MGEERTGAEIYGELETCGLWLLACSKESRGRGGQFSIEGTRMTCGGARRGSRSFQFYTSNKWVAVSKTYPRGIPDISNTIFFFKIYKSQDTYGIRIGQYRGSIRVSG